MTQKFRCPVCGGLGETQAEARPMRYQLARWTECGCRACGASGMTTRDQLARWERNRRRKAVTWPK